MYFGTMVSRNLYMKLCDITFNKETLVLDIVFRHTHNLEVTFVITDLDVDCPYYVWEKLQLSQNNSVWISPLPGNLISVAKNSNNFSGFRCKIYVEKRLVQTEDFPYNNTISNKSIFLTNEFDIVGHSYLDFFHGDLCDNIDFSGTVIDAGANVGFFTLLSLQRGATRVYSIEPDASPFFYLKQNFKNEKSVTLINKALTDYNGTIDFFYMEGSVASSAIRNTGYYVNDTVECINLQNIINIENNINLVKLDIEGSEFAVLENLKKEHFDKIKQFFIEFHAESSTIKNILLENGYNVEYRHCMGTERVGFIYAYKI